MTDFILHLPTLILFCLLTNTVIGIYLFILFKRKPKDQCFKYWTLSCFSFVFGGLASTGRAYDITPFISYFIADLLLIAAPLLIFAGLIKFSRFRFTKQKRHYVNFGVSGMILVLFIIHPWPQITNIFAAMVLAGLFWMCSQLIAKSVFNEPIYTRLLYSIFVLHSIMMLISAGIYLVELNDSGKTSMQTITMVVLISHIMLTTLTALLLPWLAFLKLERKLILKSQRDGLTKLANREHFFASVERHWRKYQSKPVMLMMIDIDHFKAVNDNYGHAIGDKVIKRIASALSQALRSHDIIGRIGGEEFAVLIANETQDTAYLIAKRLLQTVKDVTITADKKQVSVTISIGMVEARPYKNKVSDSFALADKALYNSKQCGRDTFTLERF